MKIRSCFAGLLMGILAIAPLSADVVISEFMAENQSGITDVDSECSDWIELYNNGASSVNLDGFYLTDTEDDLKKWRFPYISIGAGQYLLVYASGKDRAHSGSQLHTNFTLKRSGGYLALVASDGIKVISDFGGDYPRQRTDVSYGLKNGQSGYFTIPTPGQSNAGTLFSAILESPVLSQPHGFYEKSFLLTISTSVPGTSVRYTLDGSEPTEKYAPIYDAPLTIDSTTVLRVRAFKPGSLPSNSVTASYLFLDDIKTQSATPPSGWPANDAVNGQNMDYEVDPSIVNHADYQKQINYAFKDIPSLSVATDLDNLFDPSSGIYVNAIEKGELWERPASIELVKPNGKKGFQINGGIRIRGGFSRSSNNPKHSFRLFLSNQYEGELDYDLFGNEGADSFRKVDLRTAQNYSWSMPGGNDATKNSFIRDVFSRDTQREMGRAYTRSRYYHLYINGLYWGLYQTQERVDQHFAESYLGGSSDDYDVVKSTGATGGHDAEATFGTIDAYNRLWTAAQTGFALDADYFRVQGMNPDGSRNANYERLLDVENLIDYMQIILYTGNWDMAISSGVNNFFALYNKNNPDGFKWFCHDSEHSFSKGVNYDLTGTNPSSAQWDFNAFYLHLRLLTNDNYKLNFADRLYKHCHNDGVFTKDKSTARWLARSEEVAYAIIAESARWGDARIETPYNKATWQAAVDDLVNNYFPQRPIIFVNQVYDRGWMPSHFNGSADWGNPPAFQHNLEELRVSEMTVGAGYRLNITAANGTTVKYTVDGSDPRSPTGGVNSSAIDGGTDATVVINSTTVVKARTLKNGNWSVLREIRFNVYNDLSPLRITEINPSPKSYSSYQPEKLEFVEVYNSGSSALNVSGCRFTKGITFEFSSGTMIPAGGYLVVASDSLAFNSRYGFAPVGEYVGTLSDDGEELKLVDSLGNTLLQFEYRNKSVAQIPAQGNGFSLVHFADCVEINPDNKAYWSVSPKSGGSPGQANGSGATHFLVVNEIANNVSGDKDPWLEIYNPATSFVDLSGWHLTDDRFNLTQFTFAAGISISAGGYLVVADDDDNNFALNDVGGEIYLVSPDLTYVHGFRYGAVEQGKTWGRVSPQSNQEELAVMDTATKGVANSGAAVGPVVISEIMYNGNDMADYLELTNISSQTVCLYDSLNTQNTWKVEGVNFAFPQSQTLAAGKSIILVEDTMTTQAFRQTFQVPDEVQIFNFSGSLSNGGEKIAVMKPAMPMPVSGYGSYVPYIAVDQVDYDDEYPWPVQADGEGQSLIRKELSLFGNDPSNWRLSEYKGGSPGFTGKVYQLEVENGTGDGNYPAGTVVNISANAPLGSWIFGSWIGDVANLSSTSAFTTTVTMPAVDVSVKATYTYPDSGYKNLLAINEFMAENTAAVMETDNHNFVDWLELKNSAGNPCNIGGFYLTNDLDNPTLWQIPVNTTIGAGGRLLIWLDEASFNLHASFKLKKSGGELALFDREGKLVDFIEYGAQHSNVSYGRNSSNQWGYFANATPNENNSGFWSAGDEFAAKPLFSLAPGFYATTQTVELSSEGGEIRYTTDGTVPDDNSALYTSPVPISESQVVRARVYVSGKLPSSVVHASYLINEDARLPVVSISVSDSHMYDPKIGFYVQGDGTNGTGGYGSGYICNYKQPWRRPVTVEFFEADGTRGFDSEAEIKVYGGWSRDGVIKSLGFYFGNTVKYPIFSSGKVDQFDSLVMRSGGNDWSGTKLDDAVAQKCVEGYVDVDMQRSRPALVYINGRYWATMNIREKLNEDYIDNYHGYDDDEVDLISGLGSGGYVCGRGDLTSYQELLSFTDNNDLTLPGNFEYVDSLVDLKELAHYWIAESYAGNGDWANTSGNRFNNIKWWRGRDEKGKWRWMLYDMDGGFRGSGDGANKYSDAILNTFPFFYQALKYPEFKKWYIQRASAMVNILYDGNRVETIVNEFRNTLGLEMQRHIDRWKLYNNADRDLSTGYPWWKNPNHKYYIQQHNGYNFESGGHLAAGSVDNWRSMCDSIVQFGYGRQSVYLGQLQSYFALGNLNSLRIMTSGIATGKVKVNGVKSELADFTGRYFTDVPVRLEAKPEDGYVFLGWKNKSDSLVDETLLSKHSQWKYYDLNQNPGSGWTQADFVASGWKSGTASFGYGDAHNTTISSLDSQGNKVLTAYFRKTFSVANPDKYLSVKLNLRRDDGAIVYLNGKEVVRSNMPSGPVYHNTFAAVAIGGAAETSFYEYALDSADIASGENVIAVELHQISTSSTDLSFDMEVVGTYSMDGSVIAAKDAEIELNLTEDIVYEAVFAKIPPVVINEISYKPEQGSACEFVELYNHEDVSVDISGWQLQGVVYTFPQNTFINPKEAIVIAADPSRLNLADARTFQWSGGYLDDNEATIKLINGDGIVVDEVTYSSASPWAQLQTGATLELKSHDLDSNLSSSWRQSWYRGGSPGKANNLKHPIVLSEIYYNAPKTQGDDSDYEYLELYNRGDFLLNISGYVFVDGISYAFPANSHIHPGEYILVASESDTYRGNGYQVFEWDSGALSNSGESIRLEDADGYKVFDMEYDNKLPWPVFADGEGGSIILSDMDSEELDNVENWTASGNNYGSPGCENSTPDRRTIIINEVLTHTDWPHVDFVELYNASSQDVDVGGWWLTDEADNLQKYQIPLNSVIPAGGYLVVYEDNDGDPTNNLELPSEFFGSKFSLSSHGEKIYLLSPNLDYYHGFEFPASENGVSFGRHVNSVGKELFPPLSSVTAGTQNTAPAVNDVVISEIMYHPAVDGKEFVEIRNCSSKSVKMYNPDYPHYTWKLSGVDFEFPAGVTIAAGRTVVIIPATADTATFRSDYELDDSVQIFQYNGSLANDGERLTLQKPDKPDVIIATGETHVPYLIVDSVKYNDTLPWPLEADGQGHSLERRYPTQFADDPQAWQAGRLGGSPGSGELVQLTVDNGSGGGIYNVGMKVVVTANVPDGSKFHHWTGQLAGMADDTALSTTISLNGGDVAVSAVFAPELDWHQPANITYGTMLSSQQLNSACLIDGTISYSSPAGTVFAVGIHQIKASFTPNDQVKFIAVQKTVSITVDKAVLNYTADDKQVREGSKLPQFSYQVTGLANSEKLANVVGGAPDTATTATDKSRPGVYAITISAGNLSAQNYTFNFNDASLLVYEKERPEEVVVTLHPGWNLVSQPYRNLNAIDCFDETQLLGDLWSWNSKYIPHGHLQILDTEVGYWIFSLTKQTVTLNGRQAARKDNPAPINGWNMVGSLLPVAAGELSSFSTWRWDAEKQVYQLVEQLYPGVGYWIFKVKD